MEVEEIQTHACKFPRVGNGRKESNKLGQRESEQQYPDDEDDRGLIKRVSNSNSSNIGGWHHSRIIRVSRASGGKDRHSKVWTSKGLRDRRVRLSVTTAIQFYDLQDRLGYDQPSKAVEWLIKAASDAIAELPSINSAFPDTPKDEKRVDGDPNYQQNQTQNQNQNQNQTQNLSMSKSACSSNSETSKNSGLSLSRSEIRVNRNKARDRARERVAKEKESNNHQNANPISQNSSFTELLTAGIHTQNPTAEANLFHKGRQWSTTGTPMDYFTSGLIGPSSRTHQSSGFTGQIQLGSPQIPPFNVNAETHHDQLQHFSFVPDHHLIPGSGTDYNLNFTIAGFNRGTLQSNSSSLLPHLQRFPSPIEGPNVPFFIGTPPADQNHHHHHQFSPGFDGRLQLCYGDGSRQHSDHKGKGKN